MIGMIDKYDILGSELKIKDNKILKNNTTMK